MKSCEVSGPAWDEMPDQSPVLAEFARGGGSSTASGPYHFPRITIATADKAGVMGSRRSRRVACTV